jgi:hypothetical protein
MGTVSPASRNRSCPVVDLEVGRIRSTLRAATLSLLVLVAPVFAGEAHAAAPSDTQKCQSQKLVATGRYLLCRVNAAASFAKTGDAAKRDQRLAKCAETFTDAVANADAKYGGACPTIPPVESLDAFLTQRAEEATDLTDGGSLPSYCGDGVLDTCGGEDCDGADFGGETCLTQGFAAGTLSCTPSCVLDTSTCEPVRSSGCCQISSEFLGSGCTDVSLIPNDDCQAAADQFALLIPPAFAPYRPTATLAAVGLVCNGATGLCEAQRTGVGTCCRIDGYSTCVDVGLFSTCDYIEGFTTALGFPIVTTPFFGLHCAPNSDSTAYGCIE